VLEDAGIEPRTVATLALAVRHSNHLDRSHPHTYISKLVEKLIFSVMKQRSQSSSSSKGILKIMNIKLNKN
jgi:hypothetical protein